MSIKNLKKDTRGAMLIYVVIAAAIIILIGAIVTTAAFVNLRNAKLKSEATENFYSANHIVNIIACGLQDDVADAYQNAREKAKIYANEADAIHNFKFLFLSELDLILNDGEDTNGLYYSVKHLHKHAQAIIPNDISYTITALGGNNAIEQIDGGLILRNVHITYENDVGYYDEITTDFKIVVPSFKSHAPLEELQLNAIVAGNGLQINPNVNAFINGNIYLGMGADGNAMVIYDNASASIVTPTELVAGGLVMTGQSSLLSITGINNPIYSNMIWADGFRLAAYSMTDIRGQLYMAGNMDIYGNYASVTLGGKYVGFGQTANVHSGGKINNTGSNITLNTSGLLSYVSLGESYSNTNEMIEMFAQVRKQYYGNGLATGKRHEMSYSNLVDSTKLAEFIAHVVATKQNGGTSTGNIESADSNVVILSDDSGAKAIIVNNAGGAAYELESGCGLVIATGDVVVTGEWDGAIISGGRVCCGEEDGSSQSVSITMDDIEISKALSFGCAYEIGDSEKTMSVVNIFVGYENLGADGSISDEEVDKYVTVINWNSY